MKGRSAYHAIPVCCLLACQPHCTVTRWWVTRVPCCFHTCAFIPMQIVPIELCLGCQSLLLLTVSGRRPSLALLKLPQRLSVCTARHAALPVVILLRGRWPVSLLALLLGCRAICNKSLPGAHKLHTVDFSQRGFPPVVPAGQIHSVHDRWHDESSQLCLLQPDYSLFDPYVVVCDSCYQQPWLMSLLLHLPTWPFTPSVLFIFARFSIRQCRVSAAIVDLSPMLACACP